ncbi:hypothetical protein HII31_00825 [Pseudocercospora fuligena]|uniref:Uncharacterized protein n=1 Tax=Pseudocercospora fuligena TaxID=685502 RepID=A0A8H6RWZ5_9PEZI|nr:hypothetical protein HII31_03783 [Pseudocercospora fuligena]KAF7197736.1 hypothetical protein HII31_00825 [Pseudocercospora fuligena]
MSSTNPWSGRGQSLGGSKITTMEDLKQKENGTNAQDTTVQPDKQEGSQSWSKNEVSKEAKTWSGDVGDVPKSNMQQSWTENRATDKSRAGYGNIDGKTFSDFMK